MAEPESEKRISIWKRLQLFEMEYIPLLEAALIGVAAGSSALLLRAGINGLGSIRVDLSEGHRAIEILPFFGFVGGLIAGLMVLFAPEVAGSGIPQVRATLNRMRMTLNLKTAFVKLFGGVIALGSGLFMGREGPTVQVGAAVAAQLSNWLPTSQEHRRQLIAAGAGAGLAAAFNAPIAGVIFVLEELLKEVKASTVLLAMTACSAAAVVEKAFGQAHEHYTTEGTATLQVHYSLTDIWFYILLGVVSGFFGAAFNAGILLFLRIYRKIKVSTPIKVAFAGLVSGVLVSQLPPVMHNYAQTRALINAGSLPPDLVPVSFVLFFFLTLLAYGSGSPGGLFAPCLALGSSLGYMVGYSQAYFTGHASVETFALAGMGAFFCGAARAPLTAIVIVFEMVANFSLVVPLMISGVTAVIVGELVYKGPLYDLLMVWNGIHIHSPEATEQSIKELRARDVMTTSFATVDDSTTLKHALSTIRAAEQAAAPVLKDGRLVGVITEKQAVAAEHDEKVADCPVSRVMIRTPLSVSPSEPLEDILFLFSQYKFNWVPVTSNERFVGCITRNEVLDALREQPAVRTAMEPVTAAEAHKPE